MEAYSILMSVYCKEDPEYFRQAIASMLEQTYPSDDFVLVCDGPLTQALEEVICRYADSLRVIRKPTNTGLADALNVGLSHCRYDLVARMDSDDISCPDRCQRQCQRFAQDPELMILGAAVLEFSQTPQQPYGKRETPSEYDAICAYSRKRSPFNHPAVMYRKQAVLAAGGYSSEYPFFEDYDLWVRMLRSGVKAANIDEPLVNMRMLENTYQRRGGSAYCKTMLRFHRGLVRSGWAGWGDFLTGAVPHAVACLLPAKLLKQIYRRLHKA